MMLTVQLIRHGKTKENLKKRFAGGKTDSSLCEQGIAEIKQFSKDNIYENCELLFSSPMKRCLETANLIFPDYKIQTIEDFRELNFGLFENKNHAELDGNPLYQKWLDSGGKGEIPQGESFQNFVQRSFKGFKDMITLSTRNSVSAVVHGGTIMAILSALNGGDYYEYMCSNGHGFIFEVSSETMKISNLRKV